MATSRKLLPLLSVLLVLSSSFGVRAVHAAASGDRDGDGISDVMEGTADTDHDGIANDQDADSDNDGIPDAVEGNADTDHDGRPDRIELDSDNDGIPDSVEAGVNTATP
ncbi:MAG TPA: thrombospondin type 3 repeat-containing protein, partial [Actinomycetota bacterium]|nr:thrombospondin type 3 repeat-containing protein [Actinomycetota bacterium]